MKIALAQINTHTAHFEQNAQKIIEYTKNAHSKGCDLVVFPELTLFGYWPFDLLERKSLVSEQLKKINFIKKNIPPGIGVLIGAITFDKNKKNTKCLNSAVFLEKNCKEKIFSKELLPAYDVFFEPRHIKNSDIAKNILKFKGKKIAITICEDIWAWGNIFQNWGYDQNPLIKLKKFKPEFVLNLSASPFSPGKDQKRKGAVVKVAKLLKAPVVYVNVCGAQDEIIFDGGSFATDSKGKVINQCGFFKEELGVVDYNNKKNVVASNKTKPIEVLKNALVLGIKDFVEKNNFKKIHLGLSGGIDSAVVACLARDAVGGGRMTGLALPGPFSSPESFDLAMELSKNLKCEFLNVDMNPLYRTSIDELEVSFGLKGFGLTNENIQARLRGLILMAYSNLKNSLLLTTGNKSEYAMGFATLYGDMCGGLAPIGDLLKEQVYELAEFYNQSQDLIPKKIITRAPTAELRENQKDEDSLPPYPVLDKLVKKFIVDIEEPKNEFEKNIFNQMMMAEFKRWQAAPILRVSDRAFGVGRQYPISWRKP